MEGAGIHASSCRGRCPRRCSPTPSATSAAPPASWSPRATTRRRTTATRSTSATARRSCRRPTPRSAPRSTRSAPCSTCRAATAGRRLGDYVLAAYLDDVASLVPADAPRDVRDRLHADARRRRRRRARRRSRVAGFPAPRVVSAQFAPDPDFPTVSFPNPEEPGAMDLALEEGIERDADVVIANDPDADRCAVAVPTRDRGALGGPAYRMLRGDEVGWLLGWWLHERGAQRRLRELDRVVVAAVDDGRGLRPARTRRRSPASSGSGGSPASPSATRRRSATASTPTASPTRTA